MFIELLQGTYLGIQDQTYDYVFTVMIMVMRILLARNYRSAIRIFLLTC